MVGAAQTHLPIPWAADRSKPRSAAPDAAGVKFTNGERPGVRLKG